MKPYKSKQWRAGYEAGKASIDPKEQALLELWRRSQNGQLFAEAFVRHCENLVSDYQSIHPKADKHRLMVAMILFSRNDLNTLSPGIAEEPPATKASSIHNLWISDEVLEPFPGMNPEQTQ